MAILTNVTVDDSGIDPITGQWIIYSNGVWNQGPCPSCAAQPDKAHMYNMTWHDGSYYPADSPNGSATGPVIATFSFNGSAIYIFCAIALVKYWGISNMTFSIDGEVVGSYERNIDGTAYEYEYNVLVYSNTTLSPRPHQFTLQNGDFGYSGSMSFTIFDYLIYSYDNGSEPAPTSSTVNTSEFQSASSSSTLSFTTSTPLASSSPGSSPTLSFTTSTPLASSSAGSSPTLSFTTSTPLASSSAGSSPTSSVNRTSRPQGSSKLLKAAVSGVVGGLAIIGVLTWLLLRLRKTRHNRTHSPLDSLRFTSLNTKPVPYVLNSASSQNVAEHRDEYLATPDPVPRYRPGIQKSDLYQTGDNNTTLDRRFADNAIVRDGDTQNETDPPQYS